MKQRLIFAAAAVVVIGLGVVVYVRLSPNARTALTNAHASIEEVRARYCRVRSDIDSHPTRAVAPLRVEAPLVLPGYVDITGELSSRTRESNADAIMGATLAGLCGSTERTRVPAVFASPLELLAVNVADPAVERYDARMIERVLEKLSATRFLLVFDVDSASESTMIDARTFSGGAIAGTVWIYDLRTTQYIGSVDISASGDALRRTVEVSQWGSTEQQRGESQQSLRRADAQAYRLLVRRALRERGVALTVD